MSAPGQATRSTPSPASLRPGELIGGRYVVEGQLGKGGAARVYSVRDTFTDRVLALKRLLRDLADRGPHKALFEREYYTLKQLAHPSIIEVYDYGVDAEGKAFYTMELLPGGDLAQRSPLPWRSAAQVLMPIASSLAVLHARRLIHRDVSAANVRCTADGRAKLIDFGAMADMGVQRYLVGTPPYLAPEALHQQALDERTDLYSLGALAYFLLTGTHAYPARTLLELRSCWTRTPKRAHELQAEIPIALSDLVAELLKFDPITRPRSAAEVMARLSAVSGLAIDADLAARQAHLTAPKLVGRQELLAVVRDRLIRAARRRGSALLIEGPAGVGRSRFLDACVLEAELTGTIVLRGDASASEPFGLVRRLIEQLRETLPETRAAAPRDQELLAASENAALRPRLQTALQQWLLDAARKRALMLAIDDLHRVDEPSAALLALLSSRAREHGLVVAATLDNDESPAAPGAVALLRGASHSLPLRQLDAPQTAELLRSIFGSIPYVGLLADRLYGLSDGNPRSLMELGEHLVAQGVIRYEGGAFSLPQRIDPGLLSGRLQATLAARVRTLSPAAHAVGAAIALCPDVPLAQDELVEVAALDGQEQLHLSLNELAAARLLDRQGERQRLQQRGVSELLLRDLDSGQLRELRGRLAGLLARRGDTPVLAASHLLAAGERERALDAVLDLAERWLYRERQQEQAQPAVSITDAYLDVLEQGLSLLQASDRPAREAHAVRLALVYAGLYGRLELMQRHFPQALRQVCRDSGMDDYHRLDASLDGGARLEQALAAAQARYDGTPVQERVFTPTDALKFLVRLVYHAAALAGPTFEVEALDVVPSLEPMFPLSRAFVVAEENGEACRAMITGRTFVAIERYERVIAHLDAPNAAGLDAPTRHYVRLACVYAVGQVSAGLGMRAALEWAKQLDGHPLHQVNAWRIRANYYLTLGDCVEAEACRQQVELMQIQHAPTQMFEGQDRFRYFPQAALADDLLAVRDALPAFEALAARFAGWKPVLCYAQGEYARIRGEHEEALSCFAQALATTQPGRHHVWPRAAERYLHALVELGRAAEAEPLGLRWVELCRRHEIAGAVEVALARVASALGQHARGLERLQRAVDVWTRSGVRGVQLGAAYEVGARIALASRDATTFYRYERLCAEVYRTGRTPSLVTKLERLRDSGRNVFDSEVLVIPPDGPSDAQAQQVSSQLASYRGSDEMAPRILQLLLQLSRAEDGWLFRIHSGAPILVAGESPLPAGLSRLVDELAVGEAEEAATMTLGPEETVAEAFVVDGKRYSPLLLHHRDEGEGEGEGEDRIAGIAILTTTQAPLDYISPRSLKAISGALR